MRMTGAGLDSRELHSLVAGTVPHQVVLRPIWGSLLNRCRPHPQPLGAWSVRWADHEATALPQELIQDVRLALHGEESAASASAATVQVHTNGDGLGSLHPKHLKGKVLLTIVRYKGQPQVGQR